jgi:hypothetical protein
MNTIRAIFLGMLTVLVMTTASAQSPPPTPALGEAILGGRAVAVRPPVAGPTPLVTTGNLTVGIWTRPPYDVEANRNAAANPLP